MENADKNLSPSKAVLHLKLTLLGLFVRLLALAPAWLFAFGVSLPVQENSKFFVSALLCVPLYILLVLPSRFYTRGELYSYSHALPYKKTSYVTALSLALKRFIRVGLFILPLFVFVTGFYYLWFIGDATKLFKTIRSAGEIVGGGFAHGFIVMVLFFFLALILGFIGQRRYTAAEFIAFSEPDLSTVFKKNRILMKKNSSPLKKATALNALLLLPFTAIVLFFVSSEIATRLTGDASSDVFVLLEAITTLNFSQNTFIYCAIAFAVLYLPFVSLRK
ncbi:MAG: hypothetical protein Q4E07_07160, partial [Eubacteriales bacterium]|nr:hypothetical protein [Eubacteriales bacterium]